MTKPLFNFEKYVPPKIRQRPRKRMHVIDAGDCGVVCDGDHIVVMQCNRCKLTTDWFPVANITEGKRGIVCPKCEGLPYDTNEHGEYVVNN